MPTIATISPPKEASLLGIPAELRNRIYEFAFSGEETVNINHLGVDTEPGGLWICKQVREEAYGLYWSNLHLFTTRCQTRSLS